MAPNCAHCSKPIPPTNQTAKRYCSRKCSGQASWHRHVASDPDRSTGRRHQRHLRDQAIRQATEEWRKPRDCPQCGATFEPKSSINIYCSPACAKAGGKPDYRSEEYRARARTYYASRKDDPEFLAKKRRRARQFRQDNPARRREHRQSYYEQNGARLKARLRLKYKKDPMFRLNNCMRSNILSVLKRKKAGRSWSKLVPYTLEDLTHHLERQFKRGMSWENYGKVWHIDHIVPLTAFAFADSDDPEFQACWALSNLRPLARAANARKGGKRLYLV